MIIREATHDDVPAIAKVHVDTWRSTYKGIVPDEYLASLSYERREKNWHQIFNNSLENGDFTYVAEEKSGQIIGFANGGLERTGDSVYKGELNAIYILQSSQRKGVGRKLFSTVIEKLNQIDIHSMLVWVLDDNFACRFYEALGGKRVYDKQLEIGGVMLTAVAYGWTDIKNLSYI
ncbi:MAG: GNAT family N-acetyltransferase [Scytonematopsis contorta HA4267-MV1]|jgi:L-amino acid N-acyltransferase YncA|nr:GNAT family N-acetyltransferase [Scytonematopsis contorta HA4267-MV1]